MYTVYTTDNTLENMKSDDRIKVIRANGSQYEMLNKVTWKFSLESTRY